MATNKIFKLIDNYPQYAQYDVILARFFAEDLHIAEEALQSAMNQYPGIITDGMYVVEVDCNTPANSSVWSSLDAYFQKATQVLADSDYPDYAPVLEAH